ncbi:MAG: class I SAM-dependent methyltransferase [Brevibacillus sp.]|nr:class I SAM-dependent methyltransferase [Brevibacillus sp.]
MKQDRLIRLFDKQASWYEKKRKRQELGFFRQQLLRSAKGKVLEVAAGAGANFAYYPRDVELTAVDFSPEMLIRAREVARESDRMVTFIQADVESLAFAPDSFDTVVSTLSLCAYQDPVQVLRQCCRWCRKEGRILLLEHGLSSWRSIAFLQKAADPLAYRMIGCHQNRDIMQILRSSGLLIERAERFWAGMVHLIWARPDKQDFSRV